MERWRDRRLIFPAVGAALATGAVVLFLATRDSGSNATNSAEPPAAVEAADGGLLSTESLPGTGWRLASEAPLTSIDSARQAFVPAAPPLPECQPLREFEAVLLREDASFESGLSRTFASGDHPGAQVRVTHMRATFANAEAATEAVAAASRAFEGSAVGACLVAVSTARGIEVRAEEPEPLAEQDAGPSELIRIVPADAGYAAVSHGLLWWSRGNDVFALSIVVSRDSLDEAGMRAVAAAALEGTVEP